MKTTNNITLIIPMSGVGKRFLDAGYDQPKPLIEVDGKPMIEHVLELFPNIKDVIFICNQNHLKTTNISKVLLGICPFAKILEVPDNLKKGPVFATSKIFNYIDDNKEIIFSYCDYGTVWDYEEFLNQKEKYDGLIPCYTGFHPHMLGSDNYAYCKMDGEYVSQVKEKEPFTSDKMNEFASNGTYYFKSGKIVKKYFQKLIDKNININGEFYISLVYNLMIKDGLKVGVFEIEKMLQWGTPYDLEVYKKWSDFFRKKEMKKIIAPKNTTLILPMAGNGNRFKDNGYEIPKPLLDVDGLPMVIRAVKDLPSCEKKIFISKKNDFIEFNIEKTLSENYECEIILVDQVTKGQACTCELAINKIEREDPILISACDNGIYYDVGKLEKLFDDKSIDIIVWSFRNHQTSKLNPDSYAWLDVDSDNNIKNVSCKKFIYDDPLKTHAIIGTMFFRKSKYFFEGLQKNYDENITTNGEFYVDDVLNQNIKQGLKVKVFEVQDYICWGTPNDYKTYNYWKNHFKKRWSN